MMAISIAFPDKAIIAALGPFKIEIVRLTGVVNENTYVSRLSQPIAAFAVASTDAAGVSTSSCVVNAANTAATAKTITIYDPETTGQTLFVVGF
jgi:hypothetical protein